MTAAAIQDCGTPAACDCDDGVTVIQGSDAVIIARIVTEETEDPLDLTSATAVNAIFENEDGTKTTKILSGGVVILGAVIGKIQITLSQADTALLRVGTNLGFEVEVVIAGVKSVVQFSGVLTVKARLF